MRTVRTRLPCELTSNLIFSSGAEMLFGLSRDGDLVCLRVPSSPEGVPKPPSVVPLSEDGAFIAAGWLEGRLGTITIAGDVLHLSHGWPGEVNVTPSSPARLPLAGSGMRVRPGRRLQPYVRWYQEINPVEETVIAGSLVLDDDRQLFEIVASDIRAKPEDGRCSARRIAEQVHGLVGLDEQHVAAFVGCVPFAPSQGALTRVRGKRPPRSGAFVLSGEYVAGPARVPDFDVEPASSLVHLYKPEDNSILMAAASPRSRGRNWTIVATHPATLDAAQRQELELHDGDRVLGISIAREPSLVVTEEPHRDLVFVSWRGRSSLPRLDVVIDEVAVAPSGRPLIAVLARPDEVVFCWPWV